MFNCIVLGDFRGAAVKDGAEGRGQSFLFQKRLQSVGLFLWLLTAVPLTIFAGYHLAGPNPRDQFGLSLIGEAIDLDSGETPSIELTLTNRSSQSIELLQLDCDFGCRVLVAPSLSNAELRPGETRTVVCPLTVERDFLLPRTREKTTVPFSVRPIVIDRDGRRLALPPYFFEQVFENRITASSDQVRLATHPVAGDAVTQSRSLLITSLGDTVIESVAIAKEENDVRPQPVLSVERRPKSVLVARLEMTSGDERMDLEQGSGVSQEERTCHLRIETRTPSTSGRVHSVEIPVFVRHRWTLSKTQEAK
tara:strand:+ start:361 stop:1284 length:924 start_codon:yes stop_codon:yes gene_type:complete